MSPPSSPVPFQQWCVPRWSFLLVRAPLYICLTDVRQNEEGNNWLALQDNPDSKDIGTGQLSTVEEVYDAIKRVVS